jgi:hypothetical protein
VNVRTNISERIAQVEAILPTLATKADIGEVRADLHKAIATTNAWMIATVISLFLGFSGLFLAVNSASRASSTSPAASSAIPPMIIQVPAYVHAGGTRSTPH